MPSVEELTGTRTVLQEGEDFFRVVRASDRRPVVFTPEIVHNLLGMALEKFAMAILMCSGDLPDNHTFSDLIRALKAKIPVGAQVEEALLGMDAESDLCSLEIRRSSIPGPERMALLVGIGERLRAAARECVLEGNPFPLQLE
jgi:hypothetical protein